VADAIHEASFMPDAPGRQVVCVTGDGGLTMVLGELATLVKYKLPVKVIVYYG
jgi:pyruvate dehydrogenase (quinone)